jgi:hypothetical protein
MRTLLLLLAVPAGACVDQGTEVEPPPSDFVVPTARVAELDGLEFIADASFAPACLTRYELASTSFDCPTTIITSEPLHYRITCPESEIAAKLLEYQFDDHRRLIRYIYDNGGAYPVRVSTAYTYDELGRLAKIESGQNQNVDSTVIYGDRNEAGMPRSASIVGPPFWSMQYYPDTTNRAGVFDYDDHDRLISAAYRVLSSDYVYFSYSITYNDAARLRTMNAIVDHSGITGYGGPGYNVHNALFDSRGRLVSQFGQRPQEAPYAYRFRYDDLGRRTTTSSHVPRSPDYTKHEIYDCP